MNRLLIVFSAYVLTSISSVFAQDNPCGVEGVVVEASNFDYAPSVLIIEPGETVVWVNMGGTHDVNGVSSTIGQAWDNPETFEIGAVNGSAEGTCIGTYTFNVEGVYHYDCSIGNHAANGMIAEVQVTLPKPLSVTEVTSQMELSVFPNPVNDGKLQLLGDWNLGSQLSVVDSQGRLIEQSTLWSNQLILNVSSWPVGAYTLSVVSESGQQSQTFIVN